MKKVFVLSFLLSLAISNLYSAEDSADVASADTSDCNTGGLTSEATQGEAGTGTDTGAAGATK